MAELVPIPKNTTYKQKGYRVKVDNVNAVIPEREFERWVHKMTNTVQQKHVISDVVLVYPKRQKGISQCIMLFNTRDDAKHVRKKMNRTLFRGQALTVEHCGDYMDQNVHQSKATRSKEQCPPGLSLPKKKKTRNKHVENEAVYDMGHIKADESLKSSPKSSVDTQTNIADRQQAELIRKLQQMKKEMDRASKAKTAMIRAQMQEKAKTTTPPVMNRRDERRSPLSVVSAPAVVAPVVVQWTEQEWMEHIKTEILSKLNALTFNTVLSQMIETVKHTQSIEQMESIIGCILRHGVRHELLVDLCVRLCGQLTDDC
eukprot:273068_1